MGVQRGRYGRPGIKLSSKVANFAEKFGIDPTIIFRVNDFFVQFLVFDIWSILYFSIQD